MEYHASIKWKRNAVPFNAKSFDRTHIIHFGSGFSIEASSAPEFLGRTDLPNPEEMFTAAIASCFMLTFLYWAAAEGLIIDQYSDEVTGILAKNSEGKMAMTEVILNPRVKFQADKKPASELLGLLYKKAHENCFISNSITTKVTVKAEETAYA